MIHLEEVRVILFEPLDHLEVEISFVAPMSYMLWRVIPKGLGVAVPQPGIPLRENSLGPRLPQQLHMTRLVTFRFLEVVGQCLVTHLALHKHANSKLGAHC